MKRRDLLKSGIATTAASATLAAPGFAYAQEVRSLNMTASAPPGMSYNQSDLDNAKWIVDENTKLTIRSRGGHLIQIDDSDGTEKIEIRDGAGTNFITIDSKANTITIQAISDVTVGSPGGKLTLEGNGVEIRSYGDVSIDALQEVDLKAGGRVNARGASINLN